MARHTDIKTYARALRLSKSLSMAKEEIDIILKNDDNQIVRRFDSHTIIRTLEQAIRR